MKVQKGESGFVLSNVSGIDLSQAVGATVDIRDTEGVTQTKSATITDAPTGETGYTVQANDFDQYGVYKVTFFASFAGNMRLPAEPLFIDVI